MNRYLRKLAAKAAVGKRLCVGIDPDTKKIPKGVSVGDFCLRIVRATVRHAAVFKINVAFFEALGESGWSTLKLVIDEIRRLDAEMPIIGDAKRGDIGNTNISYAKALFEELGFDAITVHNYLGWETAGKVFTDYADRGVYVLCRTTNNGAGEFQDLIADTGEPILGEERAPLYQIVARNVARDWNEHVNCGLVAGATFPVELAHVRAIAPTLPLLVPGVGSQGGDLEKAIAAAFSDEIPADLVVNVSSAVLYAYLSDEFKDDPLNFTVAAERAASYYSRRIQEIRDAVFDAYLKKWLASVGAIIDDDHLVYTSGKHGTVYVNLTRALNVLRPGKRLVRSMVDLVKDLEFDTIAAPVHSDDKYGYFVADDLLGRGLEFNPVFAQERTERLMFQQPGEEKPRIYDVVTKDLNFPRDQGIFIDGKWVVIVCDVLTTGGTVDHMIDAVLAAGGKIRAIVVGCNRSEHEGTYKGYQLLQVMKLSADQWLEDACPRCKDGTLINITVGHGKGFLEKHGTDPANWPANKAS